MESRNDILLEIEDLGIEYKTSDGTVKAVNGVTFSLGKGKTIGLVGETGAGKTTTALGILRLIPNPPGRIVRGKICFNGEDLLQKPESMMRLIRGSQISMIFQDPMTSLNPVVTVGEQIAEVIEIHEALGKKESLEKAKKMMEMVGIPGSRHGDYPHQFSGGMKQRVVIAMALSCDPQLLIADEPTTALDVTIQAQVLDMMNQLKRELNTSMILITHDLGVVAEVCDWVAIMYAGEIVEQGSLREIFEHPRHPYTVGLFNSLPSLDEDTQRLKPISGMMPDPTDLPSGCAFHPRCDRRCARCSETAPQMVPLSEEHQVKCFLCEASER